tara:strand:+ start:199 stop:396 length:198 start_codon:yes stop_codon:yes gene_type:complete
MSKEEQPITQEEAQANHDAWWDSLTNDEKEKLYNDMAESEATYYGSKLKQTANEMLEAIKNIKGD